MYSVKAENRNPDMKVKKLRESGIVPGCVYGGSLAETLNIQIPIKEVVQLLKSKTIGGQVVINVEGNKLLGLLKEIGTHPVSNQIEHLSFQSLVANELVTSTARIVLKNEDKITDFIRQSVSDVHYKAFPSHLVEEIFIDVTGMKAGSSIKIEDLAIAKNKDVELLTAPDTVVLVIVEQNSIKQEGLGEESEVVSAQTPA